MMKKNIKHSILIFFFFGVLVLPYLCFAANGLEVDYPTLSTGASLTSSNTPLPNYLRYVFDLGMFIGFFAVFLSLVWSGVLWLLSPAKPDLLSQAKDRLSGAISGLLILLTFYLIITTINPQLRIFKLGTLEEIPPPQDPEKPAGVYLHKAIDCPDNDNAKANTSSISDFGEDLTNRVRSVNIVHHPNEGLYYVAVLYDHKNFWGQCQYINPTKSCQNIAPFAASASIFKYRYQSAPTDDGVYLYRKSFYDTEGGWIKISEREIGRIYFKKLADIRYQNKSAVDRTTNPNGCTTGNRVYDDCVLWSDKGLCQKRECPSAANGNISSIRIQGNYAVFLIYVDESELGTKEYKWTLCQAYPTPNDVNKEGPKQIKWDPIMQQGNKLPNYIFIIPVAEK